jgi:hypothetical protein
MLTQEESSVLKRYNKAVCHLHYALRTSKSLGLILGSGVSRSLKLPLWPELLETVRREVGFDGRSLGGAEPYRGEQLFQYFRAGKLKNYAPASAAVAEAAVHTEWRKIVSKALYGNFLDDFGDPSAQAFKLAIEKHPYIAALASVALELDLVVTHNFDDALEEAISAAPNSSLAKHIRSYSFWKPDPFLRRGLVNIYHPNGFIPLCDRKGSESFILTEANFADHLANTSNLESSFLLSHLSSRTWLIVGHSLGDATLKNALRIHANRRPGHVSYYVHWLGDDEVLTPGQQDAIQEANFSTYNLVTLFLKSNEINALLQLIGRSEDDLHNEISNAGFCSRFVYYICGTVSAGKSTVLSHLRNVATVEEWPERMPAAMNRPSTELERPQEEAIDVKLEDAIWRKNEEVGKVKVGIVAVDRGPLDFIAFPNEEGESAQDVAKKRYGVVLKRISRKCFKDFCEGQVVLVMSGLESLLKRQVQRGREEKGDDASFSKTRKYLARQSDLISDIYQLPISEMSFVHGDECSVGTSLQAVLRIVHFAPYRPFDVAKRLGEYLQEDSCDRSST